MSEERSTVIVLGDVRARHKFDAECEHNKLTYSTQDQVIACDDCGAHIGHFAAFLKLVSQWRRAWGDLERRQRQIEETESKQLRSRAAKAIDRAWRSRRMVPVCPHCQMGLLPEDLLNPSLVAKKIATESRRFKPPRKWLYNPTR